MKTILITSANSESLMSTVYSLRSVFYAKIISVDRDTNSLSQHLVDRSLVIAGNDKVYLSKIRRLCKKEKVDVIIPHSIPDRLLLMKHKKVFDELAIPILSTSHESIMLAENKTCFAELCAELKIPLPEQYVATNAAELKTCAKRLGYPKKKVIVKPVISKGGRGFRIIHESVDYKTAFYAKKEESKELSLQLLLDFLGEEFPALIVSEYLPGKEYSIDCFRYGKSFLAIPRARLETRSGLTSYGRLEKKRSLIKYSKLLAEKMDLTTVFGFQFKEDAKGVLKALECNPRIQGTMIMSTLAGANIIASCLRQMWGKKPLEFDIDWDMEFQRVWSGISIGEKKTLVNIELR